MTNAVARVYVNQVEVGALPAEQYLRIVKEVHASRRLYIAQAFNLIASSGRFTIMVIRFVPWVWFFMLVIPALLSPAGLTDFIADLGKRSPADITQAIRLVIGISSIGSLVVLAMVSALGAYRHGYVNQFDGVINQRIRELLEVPAEGNMMVTVVEGDDSHEQ